jgi:hypothetical protein
MLFSVRCGNDYWEAVNPWSKHNFENGQKPVLLFDFGFKNIDAYNGRALFSRTLLGRLIQLVELVPVSSLWLSGTVASCSDMKSVVFPPAHWFFMRGIVGSRLVKSYSHLNIFTRCVEWLVIIMWSIIYTHSCANIFLFPHTTYVLQGNRCAHENDCSSYFEKKKPICSRPGSCRTKSMEYRLTLVHLDSSVDSVSIFNLN